MTSDTADILDIGIGKRLRLAHMAFSRAFRHELSKFSVTFGQFVLLEQLWKEDALTQAELSRRVGIETPSSSAILEQLAQEDLIVRRANPTDRRKIDICLTEQGASLREPLLNAARSINRYARRSLSTKEIQLLFHLLETLYFNLNEEYPSTTLNDAQARLDS